MILGSRLLGNQTRYAKSGALSLARLYIPMFLRTNANTTWVQTYLASAIANIGRVLSSATKPLNLRTKSGQPRRRALGIVRVQHLLVCVPSDLHISVRRPVCSSSRLQGARLQQCRHRAVVECHHRAAVVPTPAVLPACYNRRGRPVVPLSLYRRSSGAVVPSVRAFVVPLPCRRRVPS